jgi:chromate transporter
MHRELVEQKRWISEKRFLHALNYCMLLPGPEAQQLATYIGWLMHRTWGGVVAGALFVLPSLFILIGLSWVYVAFGDVPWWRDCSTASSRRWRPSCCMRLAHRRQDAEKPAAHTAAVGHGPGELCGHCRVQDPVSLGGAGRPQTGWLGSRWAPGSFRRVAAMGAPRPGHGPALIDDDTPTPSMPDFSRSAPGSQVVVVGALLWLLPMAPCWRPTAGRARWTQMAWFFTKAALLTFGGAYAVLPYVYQGAVEQFQWLTGPQMIDGLALGETTPWPAHHGGGLCGLCRRLGQTGAGARDAVSGRRRWQPRW